MREMSMDMDDELGSAVLSPVVLGELLFDSGALRLWTGTYPLEFNGNTFLGGGDLIGITSITETLELKASAIEVSLSGVPSTLLAIALNENYQERKATFWLGVVNSIFKLVNDPVPFFKGRMDVMNIDEGPSKSTINIVVENALASMQRASLRSFNNEEQQLDFPNDKGLEFASSLFDGRQIIWG